MNTPAMACMFRKGCKVCLGIFVLLTLLIESASAETPSVKQWDILEVSLSASTNGNPFVDVEFSARFSVGTSTVETTGFYDGDGMYRVRYMPDTLGTGHYTTRSNLPELNDKTGDFEVVSPATGGRGPVHVANTYHFAYADGTPFRPLGTTAYNWIHMADPLEEQTLATLGMSPFNKIRMCVFPKHNAGAINELALYPFIGTPPKQWDFTHFDPKFFQHLEKRVGDLRDRGVEAELILFDPYDKGRWGFDRMPANVDERYVRYLVSRLAAYRNVWWSLSNEYDFNKQKKESDWDRLFQVVQVADPYGHPRSIHNGFLIYNNTLPWVTHASIQNGAAVEDTGRAELYRDVYRKPVVYDEVKYEGSSSKRWGNLSGEEMVFRFWQGTVAGTYVTHGEIVTNEQHTLWVSDGGKLFGQSPPRLAFLRDVLAQSPATGIDPIDKWQDSNMGGQLGEYYLLYFGKQAPTSWPFELYKDRITNGMRFKVEILDTWNMTITPVQDEFVTKKKDNYHFADEKGRAVALPGKPYMALRIRHVGEATNNVPTLTDIAPE